jgi:hypothetical protein
VRGSGRRPGLLALLLTATLALGAAAEDAFVDVAAELGIDFLHRDGRSGRYYFVETVAGGGGFVDADGDGDLDVYLVNGAATPGSKLDGTPRNALFENRRGADGRVRFADVTAAAGVGDDGYGMGFCAGDADADGRLDLVVTNFGADRFYDNLGGGRFAERGEAAGIAGDAWSVSCAFGDVDGDGDLDLYVTHYLQFSFADSPHCFDRARDLEDYCHPSRFAGAADALYINHGAGADGGVVFRDEGRERGLAQGRTEKGFGVVLSDLDLDGDLDAYVANDGTPNRLYRNDGSGRFEDVALVGGAALSSTGQRQAGMGVAVGDVDGDLLPDLLVTNFSMENNALYGNRGDLVFDDRSRSSGLAAISFRPLGWGIELFDADNDGDLDAAVANGHVMAHIARFVPGSEYAQANQLLLGEDGGRFRDASAEMGAAWASAEVSRALSAGDFDDDGRLDLLITNNNAGPDLLHNRLGGTGHWLGIVLEGPPENPFAVGARVTLRAGERTLVREVRSGGSVMSQNDLRLHFGLGKAGGEAEVEVLWPGGRRQSARTDRLDRYWTIRFATADR